MNADVYFHITGKDCRIELEKQVKERQRGFWRAKLFRGEKKSQTLHDLKGGWPRYYYDLNVAKTECIGWMKANKVFLKESHWEDVGF